MMKHINGKELEQLIATSQEPVICDFWAAWCGPCRMLGPVFEAVSEKYEGKAVFVKVDVDDEASQEAAMKYGITSIPNVMAFKDGKMVDSNLGFVPQAVLENFVEKQL